MQLLSSRRFVLVGFSLVVAAMAAAYVFYMKQEFGQSVTVSLTPLLAPALFILAVNVAVWAFNRLRSKNAR
jgi:hypothetical protein